MKKLFTMLIIICLVLSSIGTSFADTSSLDPFEVALKEINEKYGVDIQYLPVEEGADLEKYCEIAEKIAQMEKETQEYILSLQMKSVGNLPRIIYLSDNTMATKLKSKTVSAYSASGWSDAQPFEGTAQYYVSSDNSITSVVSFSATYKNSLGNYLGVLFFYSVTSYTTNYYDAGKTLGIKAVGTLRGQESGFSYDYGNVTTQYMYTDTY